MPCVNISLPQFAFHNSSRFEKAVNALFKEIFSIPMHSWYIILTVCQFQVMWSFALYDEKNNLLLNVLPENVEC